MNVVPYKDGYTSAKSIGYRIENHIFQKDLIDSEGLVFYLNLYLEAIQTAEQEELIDDITIELLQILEQFPIEYEIPVDALYNLYQYQLFVAEQSQIMPTYQSIWEILFKLANFSRFFEILNINQINLYALANISMFDESKIIIVSKIFRRLLIRDSFIIDWEIVSHTFQIYTNFLGKRSPDLYSLYNVIVENTFLLSNQIFQNTKDFYKAVIDLVFPQIILYIEDLFSAHKDTFIFILLIDKIQAQGYDIMAQYEKDNPFLLQLINDLLLSSNPEVLRKTISIIDKTLLFRRKNPSEAMYFLNMINVDRFTCFLGETESDEIQSILIHLLTMIFDLKNINNQSTYHTSINNEEAFIDNLIYCFNDFTVCTKIDIIILLDQLAIPVNSWCNSEIIFNISDFLSIQANEKEIIAFLNIVRKLVQQCPSKRDWIHSQISDALIESLQEMYANVIELFSDLFCIQ